MRWVIEVGAERHGPASRVTVMSNPDRLTVGGGGHESNCRTVSVTESLEVGSGGSTEIGGEGACCPKTLMAAKRRTTDNRTGVIRGSLDTAPSSQKRTYVTLVESAR